MGGATISAVAVSIVYAFITSMSRKHSVISFILMAFLAIVILIIGTKLCLAIDTWIEISDNENKIEKVADDTINGISNISQNILGLDNSEANDALKAVRDIAVGGSQYILEAKLKDAKRTIWRSILLIIGLDITIGGLCLALADKAHSQRRRSNGDERVSRNSSRYHRRR